MSGCLAHQRHVVARTRGPRKRIGLMDSTPAHVDMNDTIARARRVLGLEADGLAALSTVLDQSFVRAVEALEKVAGRIVVTGMGKSGHVAHKVAATLSSTGRPAMFIHP